LRDDVRDSMGNYFPASDKSANDGHRQIIMSSSYYATGSGYAFGSVKWYHFWVTDFGGAKVPHQAIPAGSHITLDSKGIKTLQYVVNYQDPKNQNPQKAVVLTNGNEYPLSLLVGSGHNGTYFYNNLENDECYDYHYEITDSDGKIWRYPAQTELTTDTNKTCFQPSQIESNYITKSIGNNNFVIGNYIRNNLDEKINWKLININGETLKAGQLSPYKSIDLNSNFIPKGIYIIELKFVTGPLSEIRKYDLVYIH